MGIIINSLSLFQHNHSTYSLVHRIQTWRFHITSIMMAKYYYYYYINLCSEKQPVCCVSGYNSAFDFWQMPIFTLEESNFSQPHLRVDFGKHIDWLYTQMGSRILPFLGWFDPPRSFLPFGLPNFNSFSKSTPIKKIGKKAPNTSMWLIIHPLYLIHPLLP